MINLSFDRGTLLLEGSKNLSSSQLPQFKFDERVKSYRALASEYREVILHLIQEKIKFNDQAKNYTPIDSTLVQSITPRHHQEKALEAWLKSGKQGVVSLPTGAGKTILAILAIAETQRSTLVVVPTIDLLVQWQETLAHYLKQKIGGYGGGQKEIEAITVATYESAHRFMPFHGDKFGLVVFDECHHLPAPQYQNIAKAAIAPFRLGLSATVDRADGQEVVIYDLIGPLIYEGNINDMVSKVLSPYDVITIEVDLSDEEKEEYSQSRKIYTDFIRQQGINFSSPRGWMDFVMRSSRSENGRAAMKAYRRQKQIANGSANKIAELWKIISQHQDDKIIVFTDENRFAYQIGTELLLPVLTHHTKAKERKAILQSFRTGELRVIVTSKVLNEGVDVPDANVGVVLSGSGAVREHVQRLGRILRFQPGKRAILYEVMSKGTGETFVSKRRREHHAYKRSH
ncbi:MAG: DEAD/DEAH box helicase family protein [Bdellovibrionota bacterium]